MKNKSVLRPLRAMLKFLLATSHTESERAEVRWWLKQLPRRFHQARRSAINRTTFLNLASLGMWLTIF